MSDEKVQTVRSRPNESRHLKKKPHNFSPMASRGRVLGPLRDRFQKDAVSVSGFAAPVNVWPAWTDKTSIKFIMYAVTPTVMLGILINETPTAKHYAVLLNEFKIL